MKELWKFAKGFGGSMIWLLAVLIVLMVILRWVKSANVPVVSTVAADAQNLATKGSVN